MLRRALNKIWEKVTNKLAAMEGAEKRAAGSGLTGNCKKQKTMAGVNEGRSDRKRKCALLIAYNGKGYHGLQVNPGYRTIESDLVKALLECELIPQDHHDTMQKMSFQRAARTDKGVSAAGNVVSLKMLLNQENLVEKINEKLPPQIRVMDFVRTTNSFNAKNFCDARTYIYLIPTYAFCPIDQPTTLDYRIDTDTLERVNQVLEKFIGSHKFHNFTSGVEKNDASATRFIHEFECRLPFVRDEMEFCVMSVKGQSFMLHQIRKMIGLTIAIVKGFCDTDVIDQAWVTEKMDIPKAPGLGLVLEKLHYRRYNERFGNDGIHSKIDWNHIKDKLDKFKEEQIFTEIIKEEISEKSMMTWLQTLFKHSYSENILWAERKEMHDLLVEAGKAAKAAKEADKEADTTVDEGDTNNEDRETQSSDNSVTQSNGNSVAHSSYNSETQCNVSNETQSSSKCVTQSSETKTDCDEGKTAECGGEKGVVEDTESNELDEMDKQENEKSAIQN